MDLNNTPTEELARAVGWTLRGRPLNTNETAELRGLRPNTLEIERHDGKGPPFLQDKRKGRVTYSERDVLLYMLASRRRHTAQAHREAIAA